VVDEFIATVNLASQGLTKHVAQDEIGFDDLPVLL
jgi:hypothetical protein